MIHLRTFFRATLLGTMLLLSRVLLAGDISAEQGIAEVKAAGESTSLSLRNEKILGLLREKKSGDFVSENEYCEFFTRLSPFMAKDENGYAELLFYVGSELQRLKKFQDAYPYLYKTAIILENSTQHFDFECRFYEVMGHSYYFFGRYVQAENTLKKGLNCDGVTKPERINMYNTVGLIHRDLGQLDLAETDFRKAIEIAGEIDHEAWYGVLSGNLGLLYYQQGDYQQAVNYCTVDYEISKSNEQWGSAINALCLLMRIDLMDGNFRTAAEKLHTLDSLFLLDGSMENRLSYYRARTDYLEKTGEYREALDSYRMYRAVQDSMARARNLVNINNTEFQIQFERKQSEIRLLEQTRKTDRIRIYSLILLVVTVVIAALLMIRQISKRRKREKELLELRNQRIQEDLSRAESELRTVVSNLMDKNTAIQELNDEIEKIQHDRDDKAEKEKEQLTDRLQSFTLLTDEDWLDFKRLFEKLYPGFFEYFQTQHSDITNAEMRLAALIRLNLENLEMSKALGISPDSVRKTNLRLRKKLRIEDQKDLYHLIHSIS